MKETLEKVAKACRILKAEGLADYQGHVSGRDPPTGHIVIKPRLKGLGEVRPEDLEIVDLEGNLVQGKGMVPYETPMHLEVYKKRKDVKGIVHTHSKYATIFSITRKPIRPVHQLGLAFQDGIPLFESYKMIDTKELARRLANRLGNHPAILCANHGALTVGSSVEEACVRTIWLEYNAELQWSAETIGVAHSIRKDVLSKAYQEHLSRVTVKSAWAYYESRIRWP